MAVKMSASNLIRARYRPDIKFAR